MVVPRGFAGKVHVNRGKKIAQLKKKDSKVKRARTSPRLYMKATVAGFRRGLAAQRNDTALVRIDNVVTKKDAEFYVGKRICYVYHGYKEKRCVRWSKAPARRSNTRAMWGRVTKPHGGAGTVRAKIPGLNFASIGRRVRVYLYPSKI